MIAEQLQSAPHVMVGEQNFIAKATWLREEVEIAADVRTSVRIERADVGGSLRCNVLGDGCVFVPAHRTQKESIFLEQGDYDLLFEDGRAARATVTHSALQGGFLVAFFTLALSI